MSFIKDTIGFIKNTLVDTTKSPARFGKGIIKAIDKKDPGEFFKGSFDSASHGAIDHAFEYQNFGKPDSQRKDFKLRDKL